MISPELQSSRILHFAEGRGIDVHLLDPELDVSGGKVERPILGEAIRGVEDGRFAGIIVAQLDRLSRMDVADALGTIRRIEDAGGQVIAVAENFDAGTPEGRMARNVLLALGEMQLDRYKRQFTDAKRSAVERGVWPMPKVPPGYRKGRDRRLEVSHPQKVRSAFEARAQGRSWREVAQILGVGMSNARKIIRNRVYLGEVRIGDWVNTTAHEPLMPRELWEAAQIDHPRPARRGNERPLLVGLVRCASCGYVMTRSISGKGSIYRCTPHNKRGRSCAAPAIIGQRKLDSYVERLALEALGDISVSAQERSDRLDSAVAELEAAEAELDAYQRVSSVSGLGVENFAAGMQSRVEAVQERRRALAELRLASGPIPDARQARELWPELSVEERRHVLRGALSAVVVTKGSGPCEDRVRLLSGIGGSPEQVRAAAAEDVD